MKDLFIKAYTNSFLYEIVLWITGTLLPRLKYDLLYSKTMRLVCWIEKNIIGNKYFEIIFDTKKVGDAWYASAFYRYTTFGIRRLAFYIPVTRIRFHSYYIGIFLSFVLLFPAAFWDNFYMVPLFACMSVIFISRNSKTRTGVIFILINIIICMFIAMMSISIPIAACKTLSYFLMAVDLFFLISFTVRTQDELENTLMYLFLSMIVLCFVGFVQSRTGGDFPQAITGVYGDAGTFAEIMILLFPFAFVYPVTLNSRPRRSLYSILVMALSFRVITATQSKAAFIAYFVELIIVIVLIDRRYIPMILLLAPTFSGQVIDNIIAMWQRESTGGNFFQNIINALRSFWSKGFGVNTENFVSLYNDATGHYGDTHAMISLPNLHLSPIYFNILVNIGAIVMICFMYYILRIAHSSVTCMFRATKQQKVFFAAGLAALLGVAISSMFESSFFEPRVLIMYWSMLGLLRSARIIKLGIFD